MTILTEVRYFCRCLIRTDESNRLAEAAMIEAYGGTIYRDAAGQFWAVFSDYPPSNIVRKEKLQPLSRVPNSWREVAADEAANA